MSVTIENFSNTFRRVDNDMKEKIVRFYVYNDLNDKNSSTTDSQIKGKNVIFINDNDQVYAFGENTRGCLGVKPFRPTMAPQLMNEICKMSITNFYNGTHHVLARTSKNEIFSWGFNKMGQLGIESSSSDPLTPQKNRVLSGRFIENMCCGDEHSLALTKDGEVYAWGNNKFGQVGDASDDKIVSRPANLSIKDLFFGVKITAISCGSNHSMALTKNKTVFSWGQNDFGQLGHGDLKDRSTPSLLNLDNVTKICCGQKSSMVITANGFIHIFGRSYLDGTDTKQLSPVTFNHAITFKDVVSHINYDLFIALSTEGHCYEFGKIKSKLIKDPQKTNETFTSILDYFARNCEITLTIIENKKIDELETVDKSNYNNESVVNLDNQKKLTNKKISKDKYSNEYEEIEPLGEGSFGSVFKVKNISDGQYFAIKKINLQGKTNKEAQMFLNEMLLSSGFDNDYIVKTYAPWFENNTIFIPMEVCYDTLENIIDEKPKQLFNRKLSNGEIMSLTEFFITSELFKEMLNGVNYIHDQGLMHRDLKPPNIFISSGLNGKFIKIGDFGLAKCLNIEGEFIKSHTKMMVGTVKYCAPEVLQNQSQYGLMRDIYSLGIIAQELYDIDNKNIKLLVPKLSESSLLAQKYKSIIDCKKEMISQDPEERPTCPALLQDSTKWSITYDDLKSDRQFNSLKNQIITINDIKSGFNLYFLKKKLINYINS